jgi:hypothetical protein
MLLTKNFTMLPGKMFNIQRISNKRGKNYLAWPGKRTQEIQLEKRKFSQN